MPKRFMQQRGSKFRVADHLRFGCQKNTCFFDVEKEGFCTKNKIQRSCLSTGPKVGRKSPNKMMPSARSTQFFHSSGVDFPDLLDLLSTQRSLLRVRSNLPHTVEYFDPFNPFCLPLFFVVFE